MDQVVIDAIAKWPNVPACTGWLLLDRRGQWRMRDEACQAAGELGDPIQHVALKAFIERNYAADDVGRWFFQNGPQRVFVDLAYTPKVLRLHASDGVPVLLDQCGKVFDAQAIWLDDVGNVLFSNHFPIGLPRTEPEPVPYTSDTPSQATVALLHDHDLALFLDHASLTDAQTVSLFDADADTPAAPYLGSAAPTPAASGNPASLHALAMIDWHAGKRLPLRRICAADIPRYFAYAARPAL